MDCILDVRVTDVDAKSNRSKDPHKVLAAHEEREKKKKYLRACLEQRRHFSPFVVSTDGLLLGKEAKILLKKLVSLRLAEKWEKPYSEVCGFVNARISIAFVRAIHLCLRGSRIATSKMYNRLAQWEDSSQSRSQTFPTLGPAKQHCQACFHTHCCLKSVSTKGLVLEFCD